MTAEAKTASLPTGFVDAYTSMLRIRLTEEEVMRLRLAGTVVGSVHLELGQEAIPVGVVGAGRAGDAVFSTYRGHGWALACGLPVLSLLAEVTGRVGGPSDGRGGSAYFSAPEVGFYGEDSIVGAGAPIAVGAALASRFDGSGRVAITAFGDGAMNQGAVHESMSMASAMKLPVVFSGGFGAEIAARVAKDGFWCLEAPIDRVGVPDSRISAAPVLQQALLPGAEDIAAAVRRTIQA